MDEEMIRRLGAFAHSLLAYDEFKELNALFEQQIAVDVLSTKPHETRDRERIYSMLQGSRAFTTHLSNFADDYQRLVAESLDVANPSQDDDPAVHDISFEPESI